MGRVTPCVAEVVLDALRHKNSAWLRARFSNRAVSQRSSQERFGGTRSVHWRRLFRDFAG